MRKDLEDMFVEGQFKLMDGDVEGAIGIFSSIIEKESGLGQVHQALAIAHLKLNNLDTALNEINAAISCEPQNPRFLYRKSAILFQKGDIEEALDSINQAIAINPTLPMLYILRSKIFEKMGDEESASADINYASMLNKVLSSKLVDW
ncbi:MAG: tetratricopeptide repeat protein [Dissulfurimicrobium sp.]|uniref:tetratricopeptide repeat protein n=1 Tax=Dissulfurimicrobium sp. TaxID=2022436 RepID=UPI0040491639